MPRLSAGAEVTHHSIRNPKKAFSPSWPAQTIHTSCVPFEESYLFFVAEADSQSLEASPISPEKIICR